MLYKKLKKNQIFPDCEKDYLQPNSIYNDNYVISIMAKINLYAIPMTYNHDKNQ